MSTRRGRWKFMPALVAIVVGMAAGAASQPLIPGGRDAIWMPPLRTSWQWQLTGVVDQNHDVDMYDIDLFANSASVVAALHAQGRKVICYMSAGSWEAWRPDAEQFPAAVLGNPLEGWPDERWLDIRQLDLLAPIMRARMDMCSQKGFDGIEPDNVDGYVNDTGFPLTAQDQLAYNRWLAAEAHARGLSVGLKNDVDQAADLWPDFDWALSEECFRYRECRPLRIYFIDNNKAVFEVEYRLPAFFFCWRANRMNFNAMRKRLDLDAWRKPCR